MRLVGIIGNNATESTNRTLMRFLAEHVRDRAEVDVAEIRPIPLFKDSPGLTAPDPVRDLIARIEAADGVVIATPEYDHTIPAALKSVLEWLSATSQVMKGKPVMIVGASYGRLGTSRAQDHLRQILSSPMLRARVLPAEYLLSDSLQAFDEHGALVKALDVERLDAVVGEFLEYCRIVRGIEQREEAK